MSVLAGADRTDPLEAGNKFTTLARLELAGYDVPPFFCVGASAFRAAGGHAPIPDALRSEIAEALRALGPGPVAVRGCLVGRTAAHGEDSASNPLAGVSETVLGVEGEDAVSAAVERCWAAPRSPHARAYLDEFGLDSDTLAVAVAVQAMVDARAAFIAFSADPVRPADTVVVAAAHGLGEGLVSERVDAVHHFVDPAGGVESHGTGDPSGEPLAPDEVRAVADLARRIAAELGGAQDVEGAVDAAGRIRVLQARPLVTRDARRRVFTNLNVSESFPGRSSPMTYSVAARFYRAAFRDNYSRFGVGAAELAREADTLANMLGYIDGRIYYDITSFYRLHSLSPFFPLVRAGWERKVGLTATGDAAAGEAERARLDPLTAFGMVRAIAGVVLTNDRRMREFAAYWSQRLPAAQRELAALGGPTARIDHYHALWGDVATRWGTTLVNDTIANSLHGICTALLRPIAKDATDGCLSDLLTPPDPTLIESFWRDCRHCVAAGGVAEQERSLAGLVARSGDRCVTGLKLEEQALAERIDWLRSNAAAQELAPARADGAASRRPSILHPLLRARWSVATRLARRLRRLIAHREDHRYLRSQLFAYCRRFALLLATDLRRHGVISASEDVWYLTDSEAIGALDGHGVDNCLVDLVASRRSAAAAHDELDPPAEFTATGPVPERRWHLPRHPSADGEVVRGIGSSNGVVRGRAMIVVSAEDTRPIDRDTIVVARVTDPSWTGIMAAAGGLVVERGSMLSHTAITGRLLGLPTVVCARDASRLIPDGAIVEVDGGAGCVRILELAGER